jgi:signal transduction histidine kinase
MFLGLFTPPKPSRRFFSSSRDNTQKTITSVVFLLAFAIAFQFYNYVSTNLRESPVAETDLSGTWEVCLAQDQSGKGCHWIKTAVPADLPQQMRPELRGWLLYRHNFKAPESCLSSSSACSLFLGEVGDAVEAKLNGISIGRRGEFPPHALYSKHYPAKFDVSRDILRPGNNELQLTVYSMKKVQAGIRRGPVAIYSASNGFRMSQAFTAFTVLVPLLGFTGLFVIALISTFVAIGQESDDRKLHSYARYCFAAALFLLSFSEVPREYLPIGLSGYLHYTIRLISDWAYFEMIREFYSFGSWTKKYVRPLYIVAISSFFVKFAIDSYTGQIASGGSGFDSAYVILRIAIPLLLLPHALGVVGAFRQRKFPFRKLFVGFFGLLLFLQIHDSGIYHGYWTGTYAVKIYPLFIGLVLGAVFLGRWRERYTRRLVEQEEARQMKQLHTATHDLAHELRAPLAGLRMACDRLSANPSDAKLAEAIARNFPKQVDKLFDLTSAILKYSKEMSKGIHLKREETDLVSFVRSVTDQFKGISEAHNVKVVVDDLQGTAKASIDNFQMNRVLTNLLTNAAEACANRPNAEIRLSILGPSALKPWTELTVSDNGPGIAEEVRTSLFEPFTTHGKENGIGLGLALSKRLTEAHGGSIEAISSSSGATFRLRLPKQAASLEVY